MAARGFASCIRQGRPPRGHPKRKMFGVVASAMRCLEREKINVLLQVLVTVLEKTVADALQWQLFAGVHPSWALLWKPETFEGVDVIRNRVVDYENLYYRTFLVMAVLLAPRVGVLLEGLQQFWPAMNTTDRDTEDNLDRCGDLIELMAAALRGNARFDEPLRTIGITSADKQPIFSLWCEAMRAIHVIDAACRTGYIKYNTTGIQRFACISCPCPWTAGADPMPCSVGWSDQTESVLWGQVLASALVML